MDMFTELFMSLINGVYSVVNGAFQIFFDLASNEIISSNAFEDLISNFYLVIGIIMLFVLAFSLLRGMINPDDSKQGTSMVKKIVVNLVTSTVILAILPFVFTFAYDFQRAMLTDYNPIGTFFGYGSNNGSSNEDEAEKGANTLVNSVYTAFLNVSDTKLKECEVNISECSNGMSALCLQECQKDISNPEDSGKTFYDAIELAGTTGDFSVYKDFVSVINDKDSELSFNMLLQLIASLILLYIAVSFCFDMAVRAVKLIFYQIIAPVPVFLRIVPNSKVSGTFNEWVKITLTCYLEVYIRIFAVYFAIYLCNAFLAQNFFDNSGFIGFLTNAFVVMGIIMFMKQLPKLLGEVTGIKSDGMKLGLKDKFKDGGFFAAANSVGALAASKGNPFAAVRGFKHGWKNPDLKGIGAENTRRKAWEDATSKNARYRDMLIDDVRSTLGFETQAEAAERRFRQGKLPGHQKLILKNTSGGTIVYGDDPRETIAAEQEIVMTDKVVEKMKSRKKENEGKMAPFVNRIKELEKSQGWVKAQKALKDTYDNEADKKWRDGKYATQIWYQDDSGKIYSEKVFEDRFNELSKHGVKFLDKNKSITYEKDGITYSEDLESVDLNVINSSDVNLKNVKYYEKSAKVRDNMRKEFIDGELGAGVYNLMVAETNRFIEALADDTFDYETVMMENGLVKLSDKGEQIRAKGTIFFDKDTGLLIDREKDENENIVSETKYRNIGYGKYEKIIDGATENEIVSAYELSELFDDKAKATLNAIADDIKEQKLQIKQEEENNEKIQALLDQYEKQVEREMQKPIYRGQRSASDYRKNNH